MHAVFQDGFAVLGVGTTAAEALSEARKAVGKADLEAETSYDGVHGHVYSMPCTDKLAQAVLQYGGDLPITVSTGTDGRPVLALDSEI